MIVKEYQVGELVSFAQDSNGHVHIHPLNAMAIINLDALPSGTRLQSARKRYILIDGVLYEE